MTLDLSKTLTTRAGSHAELVRVLAPDEALSGGKTIIAIVTDGYGVRSVETYWSDGSYLQDHRRAMMDLINAPAPVSATVHRIREAART